MTESNWKTVWNKRRANAALLNGDFKERVLELKRCNGFDTVGCGMDFDALYSQYNDIKDKLSNDYSGAKKSVTSVYEVGCGSGVNLLMFEEEGFLTGGLDYSESLTKIARSVLKTDDIKCGEASELSSLPVYDAVLSNSVFSYFPDTQYALNVLEKMYEKANISIGILDVYDLDKQEECLKHRKKLVPDYETRYKGLPKLFYDKRLFEDFAESKNMRISFEPPTIKGYWNNDFAFDCYMYKNPNL